MPRKVDGAPHANAKTVLVALANHADKNSFCYPSVEALIRFTGLGQSTVSKSLAILEQQGYIRRERQRVSGGSRPGRQSVTHYHLNGDKGPDALDRDIPQPKALRNSQPERADDGRFMRDDPEDQRQSFP